MAKADGPRSSNLDGIWKRLARALFRVSVPRPLASERLEALRRFSLRAWCWSFVRPSDVGRLVDAGYSPADVLLILQHVARRRGCTPMIQDDLLKFLSGLEESIAPVDLPAPFALPAPQVSAPPPGCGQSVKDEGWQPCPCR